MWFLLYFLVGRYLLFRSVRFNSGYDERPFLDKNLTDINVIKEYYRKMQLLKYLQNAGTNEEDKINTIYDLQMFDFLNSNCIKQPNISRGLVSDF
jgi:hypothetical protein